MGLVHDGLGTEYFPVVELVPGIFDGLLMRDQEDVGMVVRILLLHRSKKKLLIIIVLLSTN